MPSDLKAWEFLDFHADTHALGGRAARRERVEECLGIVNLLEKREAWCKALSRGQTQRLVLAKTLLHRPQVLILDEPASGLDPLSRRELRLALQKLAAGGATVLVDCGEPVMQSLKKRGIGPDAIDRVFLSHLHSDHLGGFFMLIQGFWLGKREKPLTVHLPAEGLEPVRRLLRAAYLFDGLLPFDLHFETFLME